MPHLDSFRAIAVSLVIMSHWAPNMSVFKFGAYFGVQFFFILSGYLISGILLDVKTKAEFFNSSKVTIIKSFYARRFLRLVPLYFSIIFIMSVIGVPYIEEYIVWHLSYLTNFLIADIGWIGEASHLWTLAVEEQFYLFWPFIIIFIPHRYLFITILLFILSSPIFKILYTEYGGDLNIYTIPITSFHSLGAGTLLLLLSKNNYINLQRILSASTTIGILTLLCLLFFDKMDLWYGVVLDFAYTFCMVGVIYIASKGIKGNIGSLLSFSPIIYLGKISYGLYLLHNFVPYINSELLNLLGFPPMTTLGPYGFFALNSLVLLLLSSFSWHYFEKRINTYKEHFPYFHKNKEYIVT